MEPIVLGLSGGVDSAVAATLLQRQGFAVTGLYLDIGLGGSGAADAAAVADRLGIPLEIADIRAELEREVCAPFAADYLAGRTPLPCALCNPAVKFPALFRPGGRDRGPVCFHRPLRQCGKRRAEKGQARQRPVLYAGPAHQRAITESNISPGKLRKAEVRALARDFGIPVADKPDSMEICFIPSGDYAAWLEARGFSTPPGNFVDKVGKVLGRHKGIHRYTLGQGRGLGVSGPHRYYRVGHPAGDQRGGALRRLRPGPGQGALRRPNWLAADGLTGPMEVTVRLRHSRTEQAAVLSPDGEGVRLDMKTPARAPTPGQLAVFYTATRCWAAPG